MGKKDKKKTRDPEKKAALAAKKDAKADKAALKRLAREQDRLSSLSIHDDDREDAKAIASNSRNGGGEDIDSILESFRNRTKELTSAELEVIDTPFPSPPRGNFTWTLCPTNGLFYMFGGEFYDGAENLVFDDLLRWDPDYKESHSDDEGDDDNNTKENNLEPNNNQDEGNPKNFPTGQWTRILSPLPHPPPRCAHSAVFHNDGIYIFGGECATAEKYHHYRDLWRLDVKKNTWEECRSRGGNPPAARSGHRAVAWRHYMILFGGFHEALRTETRWFNDIHIFDFQTFTWAELQYGKLARLPPARSACNMGLCTAPTESLFIYGGYSKLKNPNLGGAGSTGGGNKSEGITHVDCWTLPLKSLLNAMGKGGGITGASPPAWERISRKGEYPSPRAGTSTITHKNKMLLFGGVLDSEGDHHRMESVFYDDLFALDMERKRWFAMRLKKASGGGRRRRKKKDSEADVENESDEDGCESDNNDGLDDDGDAKNEEAISSGWDIGKLKHDMFAFIDGDGNIVYEKIEEDNAGEDDGHSSEKKESDEKAHVVEVPIALESDTKKNCASEINKGQKQKPNLVTKTNSKIAASSVMKVDARGLPMAAARQTPLPRINCASVIRGNILYIYGGVLEVGDREVTLDDCWSIDLNKRDKWCCIWPGQMHCQVWKGIDSDNDSYISTDRGDSDNEDDDEYMAQFEPMDENEEEENDDDSEIARKKAKKAAKKEKEKQKRKGIKHEIKELNEKLGIDNDQRSPLMGESVAEFYARTTDFWNNEAARTVGQTAADRGEPLSAKELNREGFQLAKSRYEELKPILDRLNELEEMQREAEEEKKSKKERKKDRR
mmetsp:Transcript_18589/g.38923  ORF Transcript_18589/g.38923 Transcript_18589/m.38923 type:complete len:838 (+) Transcript_18589:28-2541(+)